MKAWKVFLASLIFPSTLLFCLSPAVADSDIDFTTVISGLASNEGVDTITVSLHGFEFDIVVNDGTKIEIAGESLGFEALSVDDHVRIEAFFAAEGIVAEEIQVLDSRFEQFRVRGVVQATLTIEELTTITVLGIDINADDETAITRRASGNGNSIPAEELAVGDLVNVFGTWEEDALYARRIHVGNRPQGLIELDGEITAVSLEDEVITGINVDVGDVIIVPVSINEDTHVGGELIVGAFVEVEGKFDELLNVIGYRIVVDEDGDGDADDDNNRGRGKGLGLGNGPGNNGPDLLVRMETALTGDTDEPSGKAKYRLFEINDFLRQVLTVEVEDGVPNTDYGIEVDFGGTLVDFGLLTTDSEGEGEVEFSSDAEGDEVDITPLLPEGMDVGDITAVNVYEGLSLILSGSF